MAQRKAGVYYIDTGITVPTTLYLKTRSLRLSSLEVLFPYELTFSDFVNIVLKIAADGLFSMPSVGSPIGTVKTAVFYHQRVPVEIFEKVSKRIPGVPIDFNLWVKMQMQNCVTEEGAVTTLSYLWKLRKALVRGTGRRMELDWSLIAGLSSSASEIKSDIREPIVNELYRAHLKRIDRLERDPNE